MLAKEDTSELMEMFKMILDQIKVEQKYVEEDDIEDSENKSPNGKDEKKNTWVKQEMRDKSLLKTALYSLIGNLCVEKSLRLKFASDLNGILTQIITDFTTDIKEKKFDWLDMGHKQLAILINVSVEEAG